MPSTAASLASLVQSIDATSIDDLNRRRQAIEDCETILNSHIGRDKEADIASIASAVRRQLLQQPGGSNLSLRFSNLVSRLVEQPVLLRKHSVLLFLQSLTSPTPTTNGAPAIPSFLPSLATNSLSLPTSSLPRSPSPNSRTISPAPNPSKSASRTKAALLAEWRAKQGKPHLPEHLLLRDTLYLLQGISGKYVQFSDGDDDHRIVFVDDPSHIIPSPTRALMHKLSELGHLYTRVSAFVKSREGSHAVGMIEQSLCHHLQAQLTEYYRLVAILESQMTSANEAGESAAKPDGGLTLRRLDVWIDDWRLRMRMMSVCVENCKDARGGALVSLIHANTNNGDPFVRGFTDRLLEDISKPFFDTLQKWLFTGDLHDPYGEFFVAANPKLVGVQYTRAAISLSGDGGFEGGAGVMVSHDDEEVSGQQLWEKKFKFRKDMLPSFVSEEFGRKIFSTGKSLNFIRYSCHDSEWVATRSKLNKAILKYSDITGLERSIDAAYRVASQRLFEVFFNKFHLMTHMKALKGYLMLGHGDFADHLMESLGPSLIRPAHSLYLHHLTANLESAIRSSNAQNDSAEVLRRLDARMLDHTDGEIGWEVFTLVYKVDAPIDTILDPDAMIQYQRLFNHLWKMKRVHSEVNGGWTRLSQARKLFCGSLPEYMHTWHEVGVIMASVNHFVRQLQSYCQLEVIACQWKTLMDFAAKKEGDLDAFIESHRTYLRHIVAKALLLHPKKEKETYLLSLVRDAFGAVLDFRAATDNFYNHCLNESARRDAQKDDGRGVVTALGHQRQDDPEVVNAILDQVHKAGVDFATHALAIVTGLYTHPDQDCRFLAIRLSFNDYYKIQRREVGPRTAQVSSQPS